MMSSSSLSKSCEEGEWGVVVGGDVSTMGSNGSGVGSVVMENVTWLVIILKWLAERLVANQPNKAYFKSSSQALTFFT